MNERLLAFVFFFLALVLSACSSNVLLKKTPMPVGRTLIGTAWNLTSLKGNAPLPDSQITLSFQEKEVGGSSGCNRYGGGYLLNDSGGLAFDTLAMTEMACLNEAIMQQETDYLTTLGEAAGYKLQANQLEITNASGETILTFARQ